MRDFNGSGAYVPGGNTARMATPAAVSTGLPGSLPLGMVGVMPGATCTAAVMPNVDIVGAAQDPAEANWRQAGDEMRRLRSRHVILIEGMLRNHQPHDVLTQVPENFDWHSKTFALAIKIERLMFTSATSRENYLNESTLRARVQLLSRHLVRLRKRKNNAMAAACETRL
ncbi:hypothetical protein PF010_g18765 [Phytophthora fragariae]|nr:hypothetical protein PF003_g33820 [Phytophthora fragariae]KAE8929711.1 hypothetical protein PF009_g20183 [Phytophthora fragariae]KAE8990613.1 hypothetical protein PF011_g18284 [Phytophthora fragariae]KAE9089757.1 hypothetical protein PF007_g19489 [Phytophthora fragariae]KAE9090011.1 hypothetical protein PF010_g18765 [Phytophthora fragariae]